MAGFLSYAIGGVGFLLIAAMESLSVANHLPRSIPFAIAAFLSILSAIDSIFSSIASPSSDPIGAPLPLSSLPIAAFFILFTVSSTMLHLPDRLLHILSFAAFAMEFLFFRLRGGKDLNGLENRYFDLLLVPISICVASSFLAIARPRSPFHRLVRAAGIALHGSWLLQMAFSFFTSLISHGCDLRRRSRANYTIVCHGQSDGHRGGAIATLQFNCHLAGLVAVTVGVYAILAGNNGIRSRGGGDEGYDTIDTEMNKTERDFTQNLTLDSDAEEGRNTINQNGFGNDH